MLTRVRSWFTTSCCCNREKASAIDGLADQAQNVSTSGNHHPSNNKDISIHTRKTVVSVFMIIFIVTVFFLIVDAIDSPNDILNVGFSYDYGEVNFVLMFLASILIAFVTILYAIRLIFYIIDSVNNPSSRSRVPKKYKEIVTCIGTILTFASFLYILSRLFMILLAFATYPYDVGFTLLAIGSVVIAFLFVAWAAFHITADSRKQRRKCADIFISLTPYFALLCILVGFLMSYIVVILRVSIHPVDPVTSLASTLFPGIIAFVASTQYEKQRKLLNDDAAEQPKQKKPNETNNSSSGKKTEEFEMRAMSSPTENQQPLLAGNDL